MGWTALAVIGILAVFLFSGGLVGCPYYKVWERKMAGQAELQYQQGARQAIPKRTIVSTFREGFALFRIEGVFIFILAAALIHAEEAVFE